MWTYLVRLILRYRFWNIFAILIITLFMGYQATKVQMSYEMAKMLPASDSVSVDYENFRKQFGEDGSVLFVGIKDSSLFQLKKFNAWHDLTYQIKEIQGVEEVLSLSKLYYLAKNDSTHKFDFKPVVQYKPRTQSELDSIQKLIYALPFYEGLLINKTSNATLMMITLNKNKLNTKARIALINEIKTDVDAFGLKQGIEVHYSGLPYIRTLTSQKVEKELKMFVLLSFLIASLVLYFFFRSFKAVFFPMLIVIITVVWAMGIVSLLGYKITILTGIIPPLLIVICVENCIFFLNKYHHEFRAHRNKVKSLSRIVTRIGTANLLTNATTAIGFATFAITGNKILVEFGLVASLMIMSTFFLTLILIPIFFSYLAPPELRHIKHLDNKHINGFLAKIEKIVTNKRKTVYLIVLFVLGIGIYGVSLLKTTGNIVDDIPKKDALYVDMLFFEHNFKGIMPFEISIDTRKDKGVMRLSVIKKIDELQDVLKTYPELSKPVSIAEVVKFAKQAFYNGNPEFYNLPDNSEMAFMAEYLPKMNAKKKTILNAFVDTNLRMTRISVQMANIGTNDIKRIQQDLKPKIDSIFNPEKYDVKITGTSVVFLKGTNYLIKNLRESLILAVILIALIMALLFSSLRMILLSLIPNLIPQLLTAAMMGYFGIPIKPSTILIFSIALGISADNTIQFLSRYRFELRLNKGNIKESVLYALGEAGYSMIYSSVVLCLGFSIFMMSTFGGTQAMGLLISFTLFLGVISNLFLLPSLLLSLEKFLKTKRYKKTQFDKFDETDTTDINGFYLKN
ncbi:MAG: efflux RND transporter permease subunit [Bacteroidota bacterium]